MSKQDQEPTITTENTVIDQEAEQPQGKPAPQEVEPEPEQDIQIRSFDIFEIAGLRYVIGLCDDDNKMYNWNVRTGRWQLFIVRDNDVQSEGVAVDPMDGIL